MAEPLGGDLEILAVHIGNWRQRHHHWNTCRSQLSVVRAIWWRPWWRQEMQLHEFPAMSGRRQRSWWVLHTKQHISSYARFSTTPFLLKHHRSTGSWRRRYLSFIRESGHP